MTQGVSPSMWTAAAAVAVAIAGAADSRRAAISGGIAGIASTAAWQLHGPTVRADRDNDIDLIIT
jgi:hypothetical protein